MAENFLWTTYGVAGAGDDWDLAAIPSHNGTITAPLNADTFAHPQEQQEPGRGVRGDGLPAHRRVERAPAAVRRHARPHGRAGRVPRARSPQTEGFPPDVDWQVAKDAIEYADIPNFEAPMPVYNKTLKILDKYRSRWFTTAGSTWTRRSRRSAPSSRPPGTPAERQLLNPA